jgi:hypothetical protein
VTEELDFLANSNEKVMELLNEKEREQEKLIAYAETLTARRKDTAEQVADQIETALRDMEMKDARFYIRIDEKADWTADGKDKVEFLISANAASAVSFLEPQITTLACASTNLFTIAKPMPRVPPVTIATLSFNVIFISLYIGVLLKSFCLLISCLKQGITY